MTYEHYATVNQNAKLSLNSEVRFKKALESFVDSEGELTDVVVRIETLKRSRSYRQNRLLWGVIYPECQQGFIYHCGYADTSIRDVHEFFKKRFLMNIECIVTQSGKVTYKKASTALLSSLQFSTYLEQIFQFSSEFLGCCFEVENV
jgi:hypothetical protein